MANQIDLGDGFIGRVTPQEPGLDAWEILTTDGKVLHSGYAKPEEAEGLMRAFLDTGTAEIKKPDEEPAEPETKEETAEEVTAEEATDVSEEDEPTVHTLRGKLPDGFPGKTALEEAGYTTYAKVRKLYEKGELTDVPGIGEVTASHIAEALAE